MSATSPSFRVAWFAGRGVSFSSPFLFPFWSSPPLRSGIGRPPRLWWERARGGKRHFRSRAGSVGRNPACGPSFLTRRCTITVGTPSVTEVLTKDPWYERAFIPCKRPRKSFRAPLGEAIVRRAGKKGLGPGRARKLEPLPAAASRQRSGGKQSSRATKVWTRKKFPFPNGWTNPTAGRGREDAHVCRDRRYVRGHCRRTDVVKKSSKVAIERLHQMASRSP